MGQLIADLFVTLDGYASGEGAPAYFGYPGPELERWVDEHVATPQVLLMGASPTRPSRPSPRTIPLRAPTG